MSLQPDSAVHVHTNGSNVLQHSHQQPARLNPDGVLPSDSVPHSKEQPQWDDKQLQSSIQQQLNTMAHLQQVQALQFQQQMQHHATAQGAADDDEEEQDPSANRWADAIPLPKGLVMPPEFHQKEREEAEAAQKKGKPKKQVDPALQYRTAKVDFMRRLGAEMVGTFILTWTHGTLRLKAITGVLSNDGASMMHGLTLVGLIYALGTVSGAHFNPVVTLGFSLRKMFPWMWLLPYWIAQFAGSIIAGAVIRGFFDEQAFMATNYVSETSRFTDGSALLFEALLTFILIFVILAVSQRGAIIGLHGALAVGAVIALCIGLGAGITGGSMNPFRTLGPYIVNGPTSGYGSAWPVIIGPFIGMLVAIAATYVLSGPQKGSKATAMGSGKP